MSNLTKKTDSPDSKTIDLNEQREVKQWTESLGVSETELKAAVKVAGTSADAVRQVLGK